MKLKKEKLNLKCQKLHERFPRARSFSVDCKKIQENILGNENVLYHFFMIL
jgi:hypothetical protein